MQSIKYSVIVVICISFLLTNVSFAQKEDNWEEQFLNKLLEPSDKTNIKKSSKEIDRTQEDELIRLMKYQAEAKVPGTAALLGGIFGFGLGHYYVTGEISHPFTVVEVVSLIVIGIGVGGESVDEEVEDTLKEEKQVKTLIGLGATVFVLLRIIEPFSAYHTAVEHNEKLLDKYDIDLSLSKLDRSLKLTYRF